MIKQFREKDNIPSHSATYGISINPSTETKQNGGESLIKNINLLISNFNETSFSDGFTGIEEMYNKQSICKIMNDLRKCLLG